MINLLKGVFPEKGDRKRNNNSSGYINTSADNSSVTVPQTKPEYGVASCQSTGKARANNEDTLFTFNSFLVGVNKPISMGLFIVADGMGGHQSGEIASHLAVQATSRYVIKHFYDSFFFDRADFSEGTIYQHLSSAVDEAQSLISRQIPGGGTTLTLALILNDLLYFVHVGDSRLYLIDYDGKLTVKTRDHSLVKRLIDLGEITESEASNHPHRNVLYRALGQEESFEPDTGCFLLNKGDRILICSDGLWGVLEETRMREVLNNNQGLGLEGQACRLVNLANELGGPDNISLVLVEKLV